MDKQSLLEGIRAEREKLDAALARVAPADMERQALYAHWSVKDLVAHFGFWERRAGEVARDLAAGKTPEPLIGPGDDLDRVNERAYQAGHAQPLEDVIAGERQAYATLLARVEEISEVDLVDPTRFAWLRGGSLGQVVEDNSTGHYAEHLPHLISWIEENGINRK